MLVTVKLRYNEPCLYSNLLIMIDWLAVSCVCNLVLISIQGWLSRPCAQYEDFYEDTGTDLLRETYMRELSIIWENHSKLKNSVEDWPSSLGRNTMHTAKYNDLNIALHHWLIQTREKIPVSGYILKYKALRFTLGVEDFQCSNGWLNFIATTVFTPCSFNFAILHSDYIHVCNLVTRNTQTRWIFMAVPRGFIINYHSLFRFLLACLHFLLNW